MCLAELDRCVATSAGLCCLAIIASKYGRSSLPDQVPEEEMEQLLEHMDEGQKSAVRGCYRLDTNRWDGRLKAPAPVYTRSGKGSDGALRALQAAAKALWQLDENELDR